MLTYLPSIMFVCILDMFMSLACPVALACRSSPSLEKHALGILEHVPYASGRSFPLFVAMPGCDVWVITTAESDPIQGGHCDGGERTLGPLT